MDTHLHRVSFQKCLGSGEEKSSLAAGTATAAESFRQAVSPNVSKKGWTTHCLALAKLISIAK